jgi:hypothetical protein
MVNEVRARRIFRSPQFPRLTNPDALKETISRGVGNRELAYIGKTPSNDYKPFYFLQALMTADVELSEEMFIITKETADAYLKTRATPPAIITKPRIDEKKPPIIGPVGRFVYCVPETLYSPQTLKTDLLLPTSSQQLREDRADRQSTYTNAFSHLQANSWQLR